MRLMSKHNLQSTSTLFGGRLEVLGKNIASRNFWIKTSTSVIYLRHIDINHHQVVEIRTVCIPYRRPFLFFKKRQHFIYETSHRWSITSSKKITFKIAQEVNQRQVNNGASVDFSLIWRWKIFFWTKKYLFGVTPIVIAVKNVYQH